MKKGKGLTKYTCSSREYKIISSETIDKIIQKADENHSSEGQGLMDNNYFSEEKIYDVESNISIDILYNCIKKEYYLNICDETLNLEIYDSINFISFKTANYDMTIDKRTGQKEIVVFSPIYEKSSIKIVIKINEQNIMEKCFIDFRTHKGNGKINGQYILRMVVNSYNKQNNKFLIKFINHRGKGNLYFSSEALEYEKEMLSTINNEKLTIESLNEIVKRCLLIINTSAINYKRRPISLASENIISNIIESESQVMSLLCRTEDKIPIPHLQMLLNKLIEEHFGDRDTGSKRVLKK